jgi:glycosyltransferase involved in cell wall biosynthesis
MGKTCFLTESKAVANSSRTARVLVVTPVGIEGRGGIDRLNLYLHEYMSQRGTSRDIRFIGSRGELADPFWVFTFIRALILFGMACIGGRYDVAHIHVSTNGSAMRKVVFGWLARKLGMPYIIQFHGMMSPAIEAERKPWFRALSRLSAGASGVIILGEAYRAPFERMGVKPERIVVVHNGIPDIGVDAVIPRSDHPCVNILFSGELGERKGSNLLIEALAKLRESATEWRCTIAGNGDAKDLKELARSGGILERIEFTGWIDIGRVHELMQASDIVVLPSRAEALPLALIEGASAGAALIATDVGAVRDVVVDQLNGFIVDREVESLARALQKLIEDQTLRSRMQIASRELYRERFQIAHFAAAMRGLHEKHRRY